MGFFVLVKTSDTHTLQPDAISGLVNVCVHSLGDQMKNQMKDHQCVVCQTRLINRRVDTRTCSSKCRTELYRRNRAGSVLLHLRVPMAMYTNLALQTINDGVSINDRLLRQLECL